LSPVFLICGTARGSTQSGGEAMVGVSRAGLMGPRKLRSAAGSLREGTTRIRLTSWLPAGSNARQRPDARHHHVVHPGQFEENPVSLKRRTKNAQRHRTTFLSR
jgi:hypothetical protein